ncbi:hypothetical protein Q1695_003314 [Nippostrongylus brasiliensis]|nr:hypothetical protein Q1695_003314 [Nippostrongylus brasiliensis]
METWLHEVWNKRQHYNSDATQSLLILDSARSPNGLLWTAWWADIPFTQGAVEECLLDGLRMGQPELDRMPEELMSNPTSKFWTEMGDTDQARSSNLKERQALRDAWKGALRGVLGRALNNIRRYDRVGDALVPRKNTRNRSN